MAEYLIKRTLLGLTILPRLAACTGLYVPIVFGIDPIFGDVDAMSIVKEGYVLTKYDVIEFEKRYLTLYQFGLCGTYLAVCASFIGFISVFIDKKSGIIQIAK